MVTSEGTTGHSARDRVIDALMDLASEREWDRIELSDIAARADVSLAALRDLFPSKGAILGGFARRIDHAVLSQSDADFADASDKERIMAVLTRRFDALSPYKAALKAIMPAMTRDPLALAALNQSALNSMRFMLAAAGIDTEGPAGFLKLQGSVVMFARLMHCWLHDDDPGMARTLTVMESELRHGGAMLRSVEDLCRMTEPLSSALHRFVDQGFRKGSWSSRPEGNPDYDPSI